MRRMSAVSVIIVLTVLGFFASGSVAVATSGGQFIPLTARASGSDYRLEIVSEVERADPADKNTAAFLQLVRDVFKREYSIDQPQLDVRQVHRYTYTFTSKGKYTLKVNLSGWEFVHSPFTAIIQDYAFLLKPGETKTFRFLAYGTPRTVESPINVGICKKDELYGTGKEKWNFAGIGAASFYAPSSLALWTALP